MAVAAAPVKFATLALTFYQYFKRFANVDIMVLARMGILQRYDLFKPSFLDILRHIIVVAALGQRAGAFAVREHISHIETTLVHQA